MGTLITLTGLFVVAFVYPVPILVARVRRSVDLKKIALVNLLAGWTLVGWVVAAAMACSSPQIWPYDQASNWPAPPTWRLTRLRSRA